MTNKHVFFFAMVGAMLFLGLHCACAAETFNPTAAEEEGYWYSRYNMGTLAMISGMGETFMPDMESIMQAMRMVDADFDPSQISTDYGDGNHPMPPTNPALLQAVYKSGDPHYTMAINVSDFMTQRWNPTTFDMSLTGLSQGYLMIKEVEWAKQFHVDDHFGTPEDDFGAQGRFTGMIILMEAKMQADYFLKNRDNFDLSNGGDYVMLQALSDLGETMEMDQMPHSETNRYQDLNSSGMILDAADDLFDEIKDEELESLKGKSVAIQSLVWYAASTKDTEKRGKALLKIGELSGKLRTMEPENAADRAYSIRGLIDAERVSDANAETEELKVLISEFYNDFNGTTGIFDSQSTYTIDDVAAITGALNAIKILKSSETEVTMNEGIFSQFFETVVNKAGLQQSAPPVDIQKEPFEFEGVPEIYFRYPGMSYPPMAGGEFGIAPVFATSVSYENGEWIVGDRTFDSAGSMHAANEMIWLHYDEVNGFPNANV